MTNFESIKSFIVSDAYQSYLTDESRLASGKADKIFFPQNTNECQMIIKEAFNNNIPITISAGGTGINAGRVSVYGGWIIATDKMLSITHSDNLSPIWWKDPETGKQYEIALIDVDSCTAFITVAVAITFIGLQNCVHELGWFYPPDPTERGAFIGGNVATNASGARSFKYGATGEWIHSIKVILPNGYILDLNRDPEHQSINKNSTIPIDLGNKTVQIPRPTYILPNVRKNVAGPIFRDTNEPMVLFIGSDGKYGMISEVTLRLIRPPAGILSIIGYCSTIDQVFQIIKYSQELRHKQSLFTPMSIEMIDERSIQLISPKYPRIPSNTKALIYLEQDATSPEELDQALEFWVDYLDSIKITDTWAETSPAGIEEHKQFRHSLPETVNGIVHRNKQAKLGTDYCVPDHALKEFYDALIKSGYRFEAFQNTLLPLQATIGYALWAHAGSSHFHLNYLPRSNEESEYAKSLMVELMQLTVKLGGSIAGEHGLGKKVFDNKPAIVFQYGEKALEEVRTMKRILDPDELLNRGNLIGYP